VTVDLSKSRQEDTQPLLGILDGKFRLAPEEVAALQTEHGLGEDELLARLIQPASELARPPISSFPVG
jgi:cytidine deaminase